MNSTYGDQSFFAIFLSIIDSLQKRFIKKLLGVNEVKAMLFDIKRVFVLVKFDIHSIQYIRIVYTRLEQVECEVPNSMRKTTR